MSLLADLPSRIIGGLKRAFSQFLALPLAVVIGFILITLFVYWADDAWSAGKIPSGYSWLGDLLGDSSSLATLLGTIASSIITVTSITFSLLLIALQQGSSALTTQVTDQFLMRRTNQFYFGYFVGLSVFVLLSLVTASRIHRPVFGASIIVVLTIVALCMIVVLIYSTIDQMRPTQIVRAIHHHILKARGREAALLTATRRTPRDGWQVVGMIRSAQTGHIASMEVDQLREAIAGLGCGEIEVEMRVPIGRFLALGDPLATLRAPSSKAALDSASEILGPDMLDRVRQALYDAIAFDDARDLRSDPCLGISQLSVMAWTSVSTAKSDPVPGEAVIQSLRDILARWFGDGGEIEGDARSLVVIRDAAPGEAVETLEHIILVASESMQAQSLTRAIRTLAILIETAPPVWQARLAEVARRSLSSLGEHVLTCDLEAALTEMASVLDAQGFGDVSENMRTATAALATTLGVLNSRSTRVPAQA